MLRAFHHSLICFPRRRCDCDSDGGSFAAQPNCPWEIAPKRSLRQPHPKNVVRGAAPTNQPQTSSKGEDDSEEGSKDEDSSDDNYPPSSPLREVPFSTKSSHPGVRPAVGETNRNEEFSSGDDPCSHSARNPHTNSPPEVSDTESNEASSGGNFCSVAARNSHTGIVHAMSDASISESQNESIPESGEGIICVSTAGTGEYNTGEEDYNGADEDSLDLNQHDDEEMCDGSGELEESDHSSQSWPTNSSDRRRRRSLDSQARADAEHRGLYGSGSSSGSSKRQCLEGSTDAAGGRARPGIELTAEDVTRYRKTGAQYQAWLDNPEVPGCRIQPATLTIEEMIDEAQPMPWKIDESCFTVEPMALAGGDIESMNIARGGPRYRYTHLRQGPGPNALDANEFEHRVAHGVIVAERIYREDGPHWNEVARAQYLLDFNLKTLRHVIFTNVSNEETAPYILYELYPRVGADWSQSRNVACMFFEHGSAEYQELLGTKLGKAVACLILSSFPRGTMKITRVVTWCNSTTPQIRFEIEPVIAAPVALAIAA
ncbi:hypothetical protein Pdw03_0609 [Penicillium digitatum]|nr:hypothetical protein Pdw03_0609 [Penicillium digitatum]